MWSFTPLKDPNVTGVVSHIENKGYEAGSIQAMGVFPSILKSENGRMNFWALQDRKKIRRTLCKRANVRYFRFYALRHFGASLWILPMFRMGPFSEFWGMKIA